MSLFLECATFQEENYCQVYSQVFHVFFLKFILDMILESKYSDIFCTTHMDALCMPVKYIHTLLFTDTTRHFARCDKLLLQVHFHFNQFTYTFSIKCQVVDEAKCSKSQENIKVPGIKLKSIHT